MNELQQLRQIQHYRTIKEMAREIGVTERTLSRWLSDVCCPSLMGMDHIREYLERQKGK
jgi:transcriptional regulator with XRE-family HTH domain